MWCEVKAFFTVISIFFIFLVMFLTFNVNLEISLLLIISLVFIILGDIIIFNRISSNHLRPLIDRLKPNEELCVLFDYGGHMDFVVTQKAALQQRQFMRHKKKATIINKGDFDIKCINGNHGFIGHEDSDQNVNLYEAEALNKVEGDNLHEIYDNLSKKGNAEVKN